MFEAGMRGALAAAVAVASLAWASGAGAADEGDAAAPQADGGSTQTAPAFATEEIAYPFWTKYAYFVPSRFGELPGWHDDDLTEAWRAYVHSCNAVGRKPGWSGPCARASTVNGRDSGAIRRFVEREFTLWEIRNVDRSAAGTITGYYEPLLNGSREPGPRFAHPVYATPDDLLLLEARSIPESANGWPVRVRVEGRKVVFVCAEQPGGPPCTGALTLDLGNAKPDIRDKRYRVRVDVDRVVPYYTRAEIERGALRGVRALLWVDDAGALYSMQMQGSGKVRMPDGQVVRLAFAEQNGHPFTPPVRQRPAAPGRPVVLTRGIALPLDEANGADASTETTATSATRGVRPLGDNDGGPSASVGAKPAEEKLSPEVARMVDLLLQGTGSTAQHVPVPATPVPPGAGTGAANATASTPAAAPAAKRPDPTPAAAPAPGASGPASTWSGSPGPTVFTTDPSYVFFRQVPDSETGPLGALGVPLTAGRSLAVDPRTTPLGSPVFISTEGVSEVGRLNRLMLAQDTGGAIRGAVRADFFWGFGPAAGDRASRMKESGRMWLLLPKDLKLAAAASAVLTRGLGGPGPNAAECVVPDPDLCVE